MDSKTQPLYICIATNINKYPKKKTMDKIVVNEIKERRQKEKEDK
jgi:hypothetical protein